MNDDDRQPALDHRKATQPAGADMPPVVGIGASAGGVRAFQEFVARIPEDSGIAWVLILHMAPDHMSHLAEILAHKTALPVADVTEATAVRPDHVYIIAPGRVMTIHNGVLSSVASDDDLARRTSIDAFLLSLADDMGDHAGCALLSGAGTDGTIGLKAIKEAGGLTLTQTLATADHDSMLLSAVRTGLVDREMDVADMPEAFADFLVRRRPFIADVAIGDGDRLSVCEYLRVATGHDFSGYKPTTVDRRIRRRMQMLGIDEIAGYLQRLRDDKREATLLFHDMLIGVTQFFRDPETFAALSVSVLPKILEGKAANDEVRIWVPGCSTGEEVFTLAILLHEQASLLAAAPGIKIFGTDIDDHALHVARLGRYPKGIAGDLSPERLERYFESEDGTYCVRGQLREMCMFAQHNMLRDPPFSHIDLISCRNVLIYLNPGLQRRLMPVFHYALRRDGFLLLGPAESASPYAKLFREHDRKHRIFQRIGERAPLPEFPIAPGDGTHAAPKPPVYRAPDGEIETLALRASRRVLAAHTPAYVVIDGDYDIVHASAGTGAYLELASGRPRMNLRSMARKGLAVDVQTAVAQVVAAGVPVTRSGHIAKTDGQKKDVTLVVEPLPGRQPAERLYLVLFKEGTAGWTDPATAAAGSEDDGLVRALELELLTTKERLQSTLEELETSNEELRASNEELSSVNEELQSSNEELETSKEELQSINEELRTVNLELSGRVDELDRANSDLKNLFANTEIAMLFLDADFRIVSFTPPAKALFHLRDHDVGRPLDELADRVNVPDLKSVVHAVVETGQSSECEVTVEDGDRAQTFILRILPYRDRDESVDGVVLTLIDITERKRSEERLAAMVSELNHRVKNSLAAVQAMMRQTRARTSSVEAFCDTVEGRIRAMTSAHDLLSRAAWERASMREIVAAVLGPFAEPGSNRLSITGPDIELRSEFVVSIGLILHELATNAIKYGAWSNAAGAVQLAWVSLQDDHGMLRINWIERDGPMTTEPDHESFGLRFIRQSTEYDLHGRCSTEFAPDGLVCRLELPANTLRWLPPPDNPPEPSPDKGAAGSTD